MSILALGLGQSQTVSCEHESSTASARFRRLATTPMAICDLLAAVNPDWVVVEIGSVTGWVCDLVEVESILVKVATTAAPSGR